MARRRSIAAYGTGFYFLHTAEQVAAEVRKLKARGYRGAKFNINKDVKTTIELCRAIRAEDQPLQQRGRLGAGARGALARAFLQDC
jgi:L-alanine-DL-glutamate epimerase-like enolase superfamily enzyme